MPIPETSLPNPFYELPEAFVDEMLSDSDSLGKSLSNTFKELIEKKEKIRDQMSKKGLLKRDSEYRSTNYPTTCATDGGVAIEKLLSTDLMVSAAVAVEGLTPPSEKRFWPKPYHRQKTLAIPHNDSTYVIARALMICYELELAKQAPHDVVFLDGSFTTPVIYLNQALEKLSAYPAGGLSKTFKENLKPALEAYKEIVLSERTDKLFAYIPKYTTKREISKELNLEDSYEDRGLLTFILMPNELTKPLKLEKPDQDYHIYIPKSLEGAKGLEEIKEAALKQLKEIYVFYYRPYEHLPALRIEASKSITDNPQRLGILLEAIRLQCIANGINEPYPLYLADRMVKHLSTALPAIRKVTTQEIAIKWEGELSSIFLSMSSYRTEFGK